jgi:hypothetical protein
MRAGLAAALAHGLSSAVERPDLEGVRYPGHTIEHYLRLKLRNRYWE